MAKKPINIRKYSTPQSESDILTIYMKAISRSRALSSEEEQQLSKRIKNGDTKAVDKLIKANLKFVISVAKNYQNQGLSLEDLVGVGNMGLIKAARKFDGTKNFRFISYAVWWIRQAILQELANQSRISSVPLNQVARIYKIRKKSERLEQKYQRAPTLEEIREDMDINEKDLNTAMKTDTSSLSLDAPIGEKKKTSIMNVLYDEKQENPHEACEKQSLSTALDKIFIHLPDRTGLILKMYFGAIDNHCYTLEEIGSSLKITRERVRQLKDQGLQFLRSNHKIKKLLRDMI